MSLFILRFRGTDFKPAEDVERICALPNTTLLDDSSPHMLLVEALEPELLELLNSMPNWVMSRERMIPLADK